MRYRLRFRINSGGVRKGTFHVRRCGTCTDCGSPLHSSISFAIWFADDSNGTCCYLVTLCLFSCQRPLGLQRIYGKQILVATTTGHNARDLSQKFFTWSLAAYHADHTFEFSSTTRCTYNALIDRAQESQRQDVVALHNRPTPRLVLAKGTVQFLQS